MDEVIDRIVYYDNKMIQILEDYKNNLLPKIEQLKKIPITEENVKSIQEEIDCFLFINQLNIQVNVNVIDNQIAIIGKNFEDDIVWLNIINNL